MFVGKKTEDQKAVKVKQYPIDEITHDIKDYLPLLHKERKSERLTRLSTIFQLYIVAVSFIGGGIRSTQRKPLTCHKSLTNFIT
jgi:hypothetical protein